MDNQEPTTKDTKDTKAEVSSIAADVRDGLTRVPKTLPPKLFYDAAGSALFEEITRLPEYYLTRTELAILEAHASEICELAGHPASVIELGSGNAAKTRTLLQALLKRAASVLYVPVDLSAAALESARTGVESGLAAVSVRPVLADLAQDLAFLGQVGSPRLVLYLGSSIGNFEMEDAVALFQRVCARLNQQDAFLLGTDLVKDAAVLVPAYDDSRGVTERFNKNVLARINRELGGHFDLDSFGHVALWNEQQSRIEMHLESLRDQEVRIHALGLTIAFRRGERIHTENSYKYTIPSVQQLLRASGFTVERTWTDARQWFALHLARPA